MSSQGSENTYLNQAMVQQAQVQEDLKGNRMAKRMAMPAPHAAMPGQAAPSPVFGGGGGSGNTEPAVPVRITGFWRWKNVVVPPNAWVVHTRQGELEPLHCGVGVSFPFNPYTDSFLVVPAAMQTIVINANSICKERQGILVQGYVQWIVEDFRIAYRKLDFSDEIEPMRVVNVQLREQAEAAIKDTVATMSIDQVLSDKQPIIRELTSRLRQLAEGDGGAAGLGLRIVTVQIKEAIVSSTRLWESLQTPFRAERQRIARLAELENESRVRQRESEEARARATEQIATEAEIAQRRDAAEAGRYTRDQEEKVRRTRIEAETLAATIANELEREKRQFDLGRLRLENELALARARQDAALVQAEKELGLAERRRKLENDVSEVAIQEKLIASLPLIAEKLPQPKELRSITLGGDGLSGLVASLQRILDSLKGTKA